MTYDVAQICLNGHVINSYSTDNPENNEKFCNRCGAPTITNCQKCNATIRGNSLDGFPDLHFAAPKFCSNCGNPYPWTQARLTAATEVIKDIKNIDESEKEILVTSITDLVKNTPSTPLAAERIKKILAKVGTTTASILRDILVDVLSEATRKAIFPY
jgi:hypothetical protein